MPSPAGRAGGRAGRPAAAMNAVSEEAMRLQPLQGAEGWQGAGKHFTSNWLPGHRKARMLSKCQTYPCREAPTLPGLP